ncbi:putative collagen-binding domain-containing protein [Spirosoma litoris]
MAPSGRIQRTPVTVDVTTMPGSQKQAWWFDPRTSKASILR